MTHNLDEIATEWIRYTMRCEPGRGDLQGVDVGDLDGRDSAALKLLDFVVEDPHLALRVIELILAKDSNPWILENLGAGPLEDLIGGGDDGVLSKISILAETYPNMIEALESVWPQSFPENIKTWLGSIIEENK